MNFWDWFCYNVLIIKSSTPVTIWINTGTEQTVETLTLEKAASVYRTYLIKELKVGANGIINILLYTPKRGGK